MRLVFIATLPLLLFAVLWPGGHYSPFASAAAPPRCRSDADCLAEVGEGSECIIPAVTNNATTTTKTTQQLLAGIVGVGVCSHPFPSGCLYGRLPGWNKKRVCNSDDDAATSGSICRESSSSSMSSSDLDLDYEEIRIFAETWESSRFNSWILQILLSEVLDMPTTIELGVPGARLNLYDPDMPNDNGASGTFDYFLRASAIGDCTKASRDPANYESCAHFNAELWNLDNERRLDVVDRSVLEKPRGVGILGHEGLYVFKYTAVKDPSLTSYLGFAGEGNRRKLAETFKRPTTWKEYCEFVSADRCATPDSVAFKGPPPSADDQGDRYFVMGAYMGHFRATEENDCDLNPTTCTGHLVDYPCDWKSYAAQQVYHLGIAMSGRRYSYMAMTEILQAAYATRSDVFMTWWEPTPLYSMFVGTESEMMRVMLPPTTRECENARFDAGCGIVAANASSTTDAAAERAGEDAAGTCDRLAEPVDKGIAYGLREYTYDPAIPDGKRSPAYDVLNRFNIDNLQIYNIFHYSLSRPSPRSALCDWVVDNFQYIKALAPASYPRVLRHENPDGLMYASTCVGGIALLLVIWTIWTTCLFRGRRIIRAAQVEFLWLLLSGLFTISLGAIVLGIPPSNASCVAAMWLINFGYVLELVPLIVKVAAINRLMNAARKMRRVVLRRKSLFGSVIMINGLVAAFLVVWTILDPFRKKAHYELTDSTTPDGETIVMVHSYCSSESRVWQYAAVSVNAVLLLCATVLAFQTRNLPQDFNESKYLAVMIYSHFVFLVLRAITLFLSRFISAVVLAHCQSLMFSIDTMVTILIYFVPKLIAATSERESFGTSSSRGGHGGPLRTNFIRMGGFVHRIIAQLSDASTAESKEAWEPKKVTERALGAARIKEALNKQQLATIAEGDKPENDAEKRPLCPTCNTILQSKPARAPSNTRGRSIEIVSTTAGADSTPKSGKVLGFLNRRGISTADVVGSHTDRMGEEEDDAADTRAADDANSSASQNSSGRGFDMDDKPEEMESGLADNDRRHYPGL